MNMPKSRDIRAKMPSPKVILNIFACNCEGTEQLQKIREICRGWALSYVRMYGRRAMAEKMKKDAAELPGTSREAEEQQLAYVIDIAQEHLVQARKAIREANEDLADLMEVYDAKG